MSFPSSIPSKVIEPFEPPFRPSSSLSLRDLLKVLDHGRPPIILRLAPASFCAIVSIVLQFPFSPVQNKLLYLFMVGFLTVLPKLMLTFPEHHPPVQR